MSVDVSRYLALVWTRFGDCVVSAQFARVSYGIVAPMTALAVLIGQVLVYSQVNSARPAFEEATVAGLDPLMRNYERRQLTTTTLLDRTDLLQLIISAYLDADGAGAC